MADKAVNSDEEVPNAMKDRLVRLLAEPKVNKEADALLKAMSTMFPTHIPKVSKPKCSMLSGCSQQGAVQAWPPCIQQRQSCWLTHQSQVRNPGNHLTLVCCRPRQRRRCQKQAQMECSCCRKASRLLMQL